MAVDGYYVANRVRRSALEHVTAFGECVLKELVPVFDNIEERAEEVSNAEYGRLGSQPAYDDSRFDIGVAAEDAHEKGLAYYLTMTALRQAVLNLFAVGFFHLIEQEIADLCHDGSFGVAPPTDSKLSKVAEWFLVHFCLNLEALSAWSEVDELRLVANTVKHAEGDSAQKLRQKRPALFENPVSRALYPGLPTPPILPVRLPLGGEDVFITAEDLRRYARAANAFIEEIAEYFEDHESHYYPRG
jgi:hypothetical protein